MPARMTLAVITGALPEFTPFILQSTEQLLPEGELPLLIRQKGTEEALGHADSLMEVEEQFLIRDILRTRMTFEWRRGVRRCLILCSVRWQRNAELFDECERFARRELDEIIRWHILFDEIFAAVLTPAPEIVLL